MPVCSQYVVSATPFVCDDMEKCYTSSRGSFNFDTYEEAEKFAHCIFSQDMRSVLITHNEKRTDENEWHVTYLCMLKYTPQNRSGFEFVMNVRPLWRAMGIPFGC